MTITRHLRAMMLLIAGIPVLEVHSQPANLVLQDTTIVAGGTFSASNSITAGPNLIITGAGHVMFYCERGNIYYRPPIVIIRGGGFGNSTLTSVRTLEAPMSAEFRLAQNYPNPFNPSTNIRFAVKKKSHVSIIVYNLLSQPVAALVNEDLPAGEYEAPFSSNGLASGVYYYRLVAGPFVETKKMVLMK